MSNSNSTARIFRIVVPVTDLDEAVRFYSHLLAAEGRVIEGRHYYDCGPVILAVTKTDAPSNPEYIYFSVAGLEQVHARAKELGCLAAGDKHDAAAGEIVIRPWGERSFYARDPFGNGLCFVAENTEFTGN
jgi:catechol 2,3-dioxygenase-like lactoylglutathione lyase family enzyme